MSGGAGHRGTDSGAPRRGRLLSIVAAVLLIGGGAALTVGLLNQESAPQPAASSPVSSSSSASGVASPSATAAPGSTPVAPASSSAAPAPPTPKTPAPKDPVVKAPAAKAPAAKAPVPVAEPVAVRIPAIGVSSDLVKLGLNPDGSLEVPQPGPDYDKAGWFTGSPAPGAVGPAVIEGHIDSAANGPSVFFELGAVAPGNEIEVDRADGSTVRFVVDKVESYPKDAFPTLEVYGNTEGPELRLITCGGDFDSAKGSYRDNTVVYAHQRS